ncbi:hypothetical protein P691DRAFT_738210 [Macrolepiota fuliginosa MF-IS2]|uniref:Uncharacterized protein n=1 Tax=Macrolepiota fuliginosa MF-IS2 TaxID=1400762 RepID=A0A9P5X1P1_9AGAR|nr:hypothetical protein P691DRAFT_738210 [Macrolepiota fuliginosa MF-IS2]
MTKGANLDSSARWPPPKCYPGTRIKLHSNISLPIIWMICSRPEAHLKRTFAQTDYAIQCWREFLPIDSAESRSDTEIFIRGRFKEIHKRYKEYVEEDTNGRWPPEAAIEQIGEKIAGFFVFADTLLKHIEDSEMREPDQRLAEILAFFKHSRLIGSRNPMYDLALFYTRILSAIPDDHWYITRQILVASTLHTDNVSFGNTRSGLAVQPMCNLLGITRAKFYAVMRRLHSVIRIPDPSEAANTHLQFFHATFLDYLTDPNRAGRFSIGRLVTDGYASVASAGLRDFAISGLRCLGSAMALSMVWEEEVRHDQGSSRTLEAALTWPSGDADTNWEIAETATEHFHFYFFSLICILLERSELDDVLLGALRGFDFNALAPSNRYLGPSPHFLPHLQPSSLPVCRTQGLSNWDQTLLSVVEKKYPYKKPFDFNNPVKGGFFLLGDSTKSIAVVVDLSNIASKLLVISLKMPS